MDINLELVKRIISSDELCDKANSLAYKDIYKEHIKSYILSLIGDDKSINFNIDLINRYLRKFVINQNISKEEIFFDDVLLKLYSFNIKNEDFLKILDSFGFLNVKELLIQKYNQVIINNGLSSYNLIVKMLSFYCYACPNFVFTPQYIDYFTYNIMSLNISLSYDLITYYYREFAIGYASSKNIDVLFEVLENVALKDPYYDNRKNKVVIYKQNITDKIDACILSLIFYQIKHSFLLKNINDSRNYNYTYEQLKLVKEICLCSILGDDYFDNNYFDISFTNELKVQANNTLKKYFHKLGIEVNIPNHDIITIDRSYDDDTDQIVSIDILFDQVLKRENPNLLKQLVKNYPILENEYKGYNKKTLLNLLLDIYSKRKLLVSLNKDLAWYTSQLGGMEDDIVSLKINKLSNKISVCSSCINVIDNIINNSLLSSDDIVRSISDLITYDTNNEAIKDDIYTILINVIPKKINLLCYSRNNEYKEKFKKKIIKCYLDSMGLVKKNVDLSYFMKVYSSLEVCIDSFL